MTPLMIDDTTRPYVYLFNRHRRVAFADRGTILLGQRPTRRNSVKSIIAFVCSYKIKLRSVVFNPLLVRFFVFAVRLPVGFFFWFSASALSSSSPESFAFAFFPRFAASAARWNHEPGVRRRASAADAALFDGRPGRLTPAFTFLAASRSSGVNLAACMRRLKSLRKSLAPEKNRTRRLATASSCAP